jgi:hypothetical protein
MTSRRRQERRRKARDADVTLVLRGGEYDGLRIPLRGFRRPDFDKVQHLAARGEVGDPRVQTFIRKFLASLGGEAPEWTPADDRELLETLNLLPTDQWSQADDAEMRQLLTQGGAVDDQ